MCAPVLLTAIIIPPIVIHKQKQNKINNNKKPTETKPGQPAKPIDSTKPVITPPTKPIDELKPIVDPNITTLNKQLKEVSTSLTSTLSNKKYKNLEKLKSDISTYLNNNNNSLNNLSFEITNKDNLPEHIRNTTININLKAESLNNKTTSLSTTLNNVSLGILDIDEIISRKKLWIENFELNSFKNNKNPDQIKEDFFYLLKKNNYDTLDESIFNKDSYTYDFSESEIKNTISVDSYDKDFSGKILETTTYYKFVNSDKTWYETKMKIKK
ncbi:BspA family leucine-rich repeat surface protein [Mycoplasma feriruminatoris]|uniref:hypothetical protein n=1 Tax=Mycoplasma feriruminatoris TaxID=1179777 RepID=UPI00241F977B|nr:hypothetical protein [Mycoplasma feriruminatoris]WFQ91128.1 BspA family leucine-rich repeat surface protein [Mycoplasma feriruminatoris]